MVLPVTLPASPLTTERPLGSTAQVLTDLALAPADFSLLVLILTPKDLPAFTFLGALIESFSFGTGPVKVAVTERASLIVTTQFPVPEHPEPDQPLKVDPEVGVAVRVTVVPS